ncbi:hypothetical protein [Furfurilactobacillus siliginis]|uniref:Uncharacterized protein n=1 Tax=Furfurilactobacillus siliginis TaxID=348151 RepID=A0A0R2L695_9LACO|nr:hypothetical protein [Furfurilactobacillus siliginis]KRN97278.1 hypothetical protein IV55_GL000206 [Furfurilactobacillus siliginis]GEK28589.1 hypothetical protein LSI01_09000 [Furfurilactobacillus siliginis]
MTLNSEAQAALKVIQQTITKCERMVPKFAEGTAQATLLKNRIQALQVARQLIVGDGTAVTGDQVMAAKAPIASIIHKTRTARAKYDVDSLMDRRTRPLLAAMLVAQAYLEDFNR